MEKDIELIERYLDKELSAEELGAFKQRLQSDKEFFNLLQFREKIQRSWQTADEFESTKTLLKKLHMKNANTISKKFYWAAAVAILLLAIPLAMKFNNNSNKLQMDEIESKASVEFKDERFKQTYPLHGQIVKSGSILFSWESALDVKTAIVLTEIETKEVYIISPIVSDQKKYILRDSMPPGKYEWKMEGFKGTQMFIVK